MSSTVSLDQVVKWPFLMAWGKLFLTGIKRPGWYHLDRSNLLLDARSLNSSGCC